MTAFARSEDRTRALLEGYQPHVAKPVEPAELIAVVAPAPPGAQGHAPEFAGGVLDLSGTSSTVEEPVT